MTENYVPQKLQITENENEHERIKTVLTKVLQDNVAILRMIEDILDTPQTEDKSHLDLLIDRIERGNNQ